MPLSTLCLHCGMCCDGTLFTQVPLQPHESGALGQRGLPLTTREDGAVVLPQPCAALNGRCCTAYTERPEACRRYRCQLLNALAEGEVSLDEAKGVVDAAHARVEAVARSLPPPEDGVAAAPASMMRRARAEAAALSPEAREALTQAEAFLDRHFRGRFRRSG
ncbi:YkgJ family cysteine cluster protein [Corallococcus sp. BB11-1]|uniref:YkgJ family cysteine cluster protein n=1 Tax=Corallococcus sp. BB11-1 TaxID=2996783 RepID=UPI0010D2EF39|nr:YkgJ family cysteine cluster protein [Corallococcus sp. BB11-1]MCY1029906.1 YkgJ family cysteine cluster protein [Corallococcus sp. BB11-1]RYZ44325.1 MAG: YkgJ family cysteine cluster protein [Myxococcaceae bacterium]